MVDEVLRARSHWTSQISYRAQASLVRTQSVWAVLLCSHSSAIKYNGSLEVSHSHFHDKRYDMVDKVQVQRARSHSGPLRLATELKHRLYARNPSGQRLCACMVSSISVMGH